MAWSDSMVGENIMGFDTGGGLLLPRLGRLGFCPLLEVMGNRL